MNEENLVAFVAGVAPNFSVATPTPALTRRQLRLGLLALGFTKKQIGDIIATLPEPDRSVATIEWEDSSTYERAHPLVAQIATALGLTTEALDAAWAISATR